jgi:hypothetical protein
MAREGLRGMTHGRNDGFGGCTTVDRMAIELDEEGIEGVAKSVS